jgi:hypothetical protein
MPDSSEPQEETEAGRSNFTSWLPYSGLSLIAKACPYNFEVAQLQSQDTVIEELLVTL